MSEVPRRVRRRRWVQALALAAAAAVLSSSFGQALALSEPPPLIGGAELGADAGQPARPEGSHVLRIPDPSQRPEAPDLPVAAPYPTRSPLAAASVANWTVLVYMVADNNLEPFAMQDLNEMEASAPNPSVNVIVEVDRSQAYDTSNDDWTSTRRYEIGRDSEPSLLSSVMLADLGERNMGDPQTLVEFLVWGADAFPAQHYLVDLWDHGYGWSGGVGDDLGDGDHLSLAEIGAAMRAGAVHLGRPFDIVGFDACLMQQADVAYELAWVADFMVAAEDLEPAAGWVYDEMLAPIMNDESLSPSAFARSLVETYMGYYGRKGEAMMSTLNLKPFRTAGVNALNRLALALSAAVEPPATMGAGSAEQAMWEARDRSPSMFNVDYVDLGEFARRLAEDPRVPPNARQAASDARVALNLTVVAESHSVYRPGLAGLSVYIPGSTVPPRYLATRLANDTYWDEFLLAFLSGAPAGGAEPSFQLTSPSEAAVVARFFDASATASAPAAAGLTFQFKQGFENWSDVGAGPSPLLFGGALDAGIEAGAAVVGFRAVDDLDRPSVAFERTLNVEAAPVALWPPLSDFPLAVNRTRAVNLTATPRNPYTSFDLEWRGLPAGIDSLGSSTTATTSGDPPAAFNLTLQLRASPSAAEGTFPIEVRVHAAAAPSLFTRLPLQLFVTRPLPDLALEPLSLSEDLPLPGQVLTAWTNLSNAGFEDAPGARVVAVFTDGASSTELANLTTGLLAPGAVLPIAVNFTTVFGAQRLNISVSSEPAAEELSITNNARERVLNIVNFSAALFAPPLPVAGSLGAGPIAVSMRLLNAGVQPDQYNLSVAGFSDGSWQAALPFPNLFLPGRTGLNFTVDVLAPATAEGGDGVTFTVTAVSQADGTVTATASVEVRIEELFNASVRAQPNDVNVSRGGSTNVTLSVQNLGNGHEAFSLLVQNGAPKLAATLNLSTFVLPPGAAASSRLSLRDVGLLSTDRPYTLEAVAVSQATGVRFTTIVSVSVLPAPSLEVAPLEGRVNVSANGTAVFHVSLRNTGNTHVVAAVSSAAAEPTLQTQVAGPGALLVPGATAVLNGTALFTAAPLAGDYTVTVQAVDETTGTAGQGLVTLTVAAVHDFAVVVSPAPTGGAGRTVERTLTLSNRGNVPETFDLVLGLVEINIDVVLRPSGPIVVPARSEAKVTVQIQGPANGAASGEVPLTVTPSSGAGSKTVAVPYSFQPPPPDPVLGWGIVLGASAIALGGWFVLTGKRGPKKPEPGARP